ncbi:MAG TPA: hypothetical protein VGM19_06320 [Armatimonadota bacterium]
MLAAGALAGALLGLAGCGGGTPAGMMSSSDHSDPHISGEAFPATLQPASQAQAKEVDFSGARGLQLTNGLVTVVVVPAAGGRILSYQLGKYEYMYRDAASGKAAQTGGDAARPVNAKGEIQGGALEGAWQGQVTTAAGTFAEVKLTSPEDKTGAGVALTRTLRLYAGSTRLQVTDTLRNLSDKPATWALGATTRLVAAGSGQARAFLPVTAAPGHPTGFWSPAGAADGQATALNEGKLLQVATDGKPGRIDAHLRDGWVAYSETVANHVLVRRFSPTAGGDYPGGASAAVTLPGKTSYLALSSSTPLQSLPAGGELTLTQDWYASLLPGAVMDTSEIAALNQPPVLRTEGSGYRLQAKLAVFAPGNLVITLLDASGQPVSTPTLVPVSPQQPVTLDQTLTAPGGATTVRLAVENAQGLPLGDLASVPLPGRAG